MSRRPGKSPQGPRPRIALPLHRDDAGREFAYDREFRPSSLVEAPDRADAYGITVVSMKEAWNVVVPQSDAGAPEQRVSS
jgi:hypothetical protein